ncbi:MAG TPA: ABC transporter ATP-binding protein [bacterium]|nr:ABC transporter ATP-binding protein [bacterium]
MTTGRDGAAGRADPAGRLVVSARNVAKHYEMPGGVVYALRGVSLDVERGACLAILGPSGCGKSTLLHLLGGVDVPTSGSVDVLGHDTARLSDGALARLRLFHIGFVFQRFFLLPMLTAEENVLLPMMEAGVPAAERRDRARALLGRVGLAARVHHRPGQLSGGEMQRAAIARALANQPQIVLADEPTGELDEATGREIGALLHDLSREGIAVVMVTHNPELAGMADRSIRMKDGAIA